MLLADAPPIPAPDQYGIPAHSAVFIFLYHLTFLLHLLFMNFSLGGTVIALVNDVRCLIDPRRREYLADLNRRIFAALPVTISFAITFGVAPLLFVQVLYGQFFYSAKVLVGLPMMAIIGILLVVFYLAYVVGIRKRDTTPARSLGRAGISLAMTLGFLAIAWLWTLNTVMSMNPQLWSERHASGDWLPLVADSHIWPRYVHNIIGATAVACVLIAVMARVLLHRGAVSDDWARRTVRGLMLAALVLTGLQAVDGVGILAMIDGGARSDLLAGWTSYSAWLWKLGVLLVAPLVACLWMGFRNPDRGRWTWGAAGLLVVILVGMSMARQSLRDSYLRIHGQGFDVFADWSGATHWQWGAIIMFAVTLVVGLAVVAWLLWTVWNLRGTPPAAASTATDSAVLHPADEPEQFEAPEHRPELSGDEDAPRLPPDAPAE